jgi:amino acid adenylation domain-containing protein
MNVATRDRIGSLSPEQRARLQEKLLARKVFSSAVSPIPRRGSTDPCPLSFAQELLWLLDRLIPGMNSAYNVPRAIRLSGALDFDSLRRALDGLVDRHEVLRTNYIFRDGAPLQVIAPSAPVEIREIDLTGCSAEDRESEVQRILFAESCLRFDMENDPMFRVTLMRLAEQEHILIMVTHHIASDGWSREQMFREIVELYTAGIEGREATLPELPIQYADYAVWQRRWMESGALEENLKYWKGHLAGAPKITELPTDRPRSRMQSYKGAREPMLFPRGLVNRLHELGRDEGATLFMTTLAALQVLLHRYTGQDDLVIGTPVAGRGRAELEPLIGYFSNTLALRTDLSGDPTFRQLLGRVREVAVGGYAHQDMPFEKVVVELNPERDLSYSPVFQVLFTAGTARAFGLTLPGLAVTPLWVDRGCTKFELTLGLTDRPEGMTGTFEYSTDLFDSATIRRMIGHLGRILEGVAEDPDRRISRLELLGDADRREILISGYTPAATFDRTRLVHDLFAEQARRNPEGSAVEHQGEVLTYRELNERANRLAHHLTAMGVGPESRVGICLPRSPMILVGVLGVLKAGGAYVPMDPEDPPERLAKIARDSGIRTLVTVGSIRADWVDATSSVVRLDVDRREIDRNSAKDPAVAVRPDTLAYVIYTSGSTGEPRGVMVEHGGLTNAYYGWEAAYQLGTVMKRHLQMARFTFDVFTGDWVRALCSGGTLVLCPREVLLDPKALHAMIRRERIDGGEFVPIVLDALVDEFEAAGGAPDGLRLIVTSSDIWRVGQHERLLRVCGPGTRVVNCYGVTEATIDSTYFEGRLMDRTPEAIMPIGRPYAGTRVYVLDRHLQPVPVGIPGELCIGGPGVARGYLGQPELTARKFVRDPFAGDPGAWMYRSGDLAKWRPDGTLEFLGRGDHQVKIRGFRIELAEVEAALARHPNVRQSAVIVRRDRMGQDALAAYVLAGQDPAPSASELRQHLSRMLPEYMVPAAFVALASMPMTSSGKVDRRALPAPEAPEAESSEMVAPRTPIEEVVATIWAEVLGLERVGVFSNFFELGGHSLRVWQVIARLRDVLGVQLTMRAFFDAPTIADMASFVEGQLEEAATVA